MLSCKAEFLIECLVRCACTKMINAHCNTSASHPAFPAESYAGFDGDARHYGGRQNFVAVAFWLPCKKIPAGHGHNARSHILRGEHGLRLQGNVHF